MDRTCSSCGRPLPPIDVSEAGVLALKWSAALVCDDCGALEDAEKDSTLKERQLKSGIPVAGPVSLDSLASRFSTTAVDVAVRWSEGEFPLLTLFARDDVLPDDLAIAAATLRLEIGGVRWLSAGDPEDRETAMREKGVGGAMVFADLDQASLIKNTMSETNPVITYRQRHELPLLITSSVSATELARTAGEPLLHRLRRYGKAVHVAEKKGP